MHNTIILTKWSELFDFFIKEDKELISDILYRIEKYLFHRFNDFDLEFKTMQFTPRSKHIKIFESKSETMLIFNFYAFVPGLIYTDLIHKRLILINIQEYYNFIYNYIVGAVGSVQNLRYSRYILSLHPVFYKLMKLNQINRPLLHYHKDIIGIPIIKENQKYVDILVNSKRKQLIYVKTFEEYFNLDEHNYFEALFNKTLFGYSYFFMIKNKDCLCYDGFLYGKKFQIIYLYNLTIINLYHTYYINIPDFNLVVRKLIFNESISLNNKEDLIKMCSKLEEVF